jgi:hypothetical protein
MKGHLRRCRSALRAHGFRRGVLQYAPTGAQGPPLLRHPSGLRRFHFAPLARGGFAWHLTFPEQAPTGVSRKGF